MSEEKCVKAGETCCGGEINEPSERIEGGRLTLSVTIFGKPLKNICLSAVHRKLALSYVLHAES